MSGLYAGSVISFVPATARYVANNLICADSNEPEQVTRDAVPVVGWALLTYPAGTTTHTSLEAMVHPWPGADELAPVTNFGDPDAAVTVLIGVHPEGVESTAKDVADSVRDVRIEVTRLRDRNRQWIEQHRAGNGAGQLLAASLYLGMCEADAVRLGPAGFRSRGAGGPQSQRGRRAPPRQPSGP